MTQMSLFMSPPAVNREGEDETEAEPCSVLGERNYTAGAGSLRKGRE